MKYKSVTSAPSYTQIRVYSHRWERHFGIPAKCLNQITYNFKQPACNDERFWLLQFLVKGTYFVSASNFEDLLWASYRGADPHSRTLYTPHLKILFDSQIVDMTYGPWLSEMGFQLAQKMHSFWLTEEEQVLMRAISTLAPGERVYSNESHSYTSILMRAISTLVF